MIVSPKVICLVLAIVLFFLAMVFNLWRPTENRFNLVAGGLFFYALREAFA